MRAAAATCDLSTRTAVQHTPWFSGMRSVCAAQTVATLKMMWPGLCTSSRGSAHANAQTCFRAGGRRHLRRPWRIHDHAASRVTAGPTPCRVSQLGSVRGARVGYSCAWPRRYETELPSESKSGSAADKGPGNGVTQPLLPLLRCWGVSYEGTPPRNRRPPWGTRAAPLEGSLGRGSSSYWLRAEARQCAPPSPSRGAAPLPVATPGEATGRPGARQVLTDPEPRESNLEARPRCEAQHVHNKGLEGRGTDGANIRKTRGE